MQASVDRIRRVANQSEHRLQASDFWTAILSQGGIDLGGLADSSDPPGPGLEDIRALALRVFRKAGIQQEPEPEVIDLEKEKDSEQQEEDQ